MVNYKVIGASDKQDELSPSDPLSASRVIHLVVFPRDRVPIKQRSFLVSSLLVTNSQQLQSNIRRSWKNNERVRKYPIRPQPVTPREKSQREEEQKIRVALLDTWRDPQTPAGNPSKVNIRLPNMTVGSFGCSQVQKEDPEILDCRQSRLSLHFWQTSLFLRPALLFKKNMVSPTSGPRR